MRMSKHEYFMELAKVAAKRGTCLKKQVGCVVVNANGHILAITYNGQAKHQQHCDKTNPCPAYKDSSQACQALHAEWNSLVRVEDPDKIETIYITEAPCDRCLMMIKNTSCKQIIYNDPEIGRAWIYLDQEIKLI